jgi:hypothetical protein
MRHLDRVREQWLAAAGLGLALVALLLALVPGGSHSETDVLALRHAVAAGAIVQASDVVSVPIARADRTPSMLTSLGALAGHRAAIGLAGGDFLLRGALTARARASLVRHGERAVALEVAPAAAPDARLLRPGRYVDVLVMATHGSRVAARGLEIISPASERSGAIAVTVRAPAAVAVALATSRGELRLLLRGNAP